jgi:hypothetical protein
VRRFLNSVAIAAGCFVAYVAWGELRADRMLIRRQAEQQRGMSPDRQAWMEGK